MLKLHGSALVLAASLGLVHAGWAQSNPSAADLINSLKPSAQAVKSSDIRGLHRLVGPSDGASQEASVVQPVRRAAPTTQTASTNAEAPSASLFVQFANGSAELTPQAAAALDELGKALSSDALANYHFRIEGHTDTVGSKEYNRALSERRADAVVAYIRQKYGVAESRLVPVGLGSDELLVPTADQTPEARNRRVKVVNLGS
jgi:outer membrane protein OmpA-like peptidoglycan-associated protein